MKSIKQGRGPSFMGGIASVIAAVFGICWIGVTIKIGAGFMVIFGVLFVCMAAASAVYNFTQATSKNRFSAFDITESGEEEDPLNKRFGAQSENIGGEKKDETKQEGDYCPYCGAKTENGYEYCRKCGKKLP